LLAYLIVIAILAYLVQPAAMMLKPS
jgi:hypothetical protein